MDAASGRTLQLWGVPTCCETRTGSCCRLGLGSTTAGRFIPGSTCLCRHVMANACTALPLVGSHRSWIDNYWMITNDWITNWDNYWMTIVIIDYRYDQNSTVEWPLGWQTPMTLNDHEYWPYRLLAVVCLSTSTTSHCQPVYYNYNPYTNHCKSSLVNHNHVGAMPLVIILDYEALLAINFLWETMVSQLASEIHWWSIGPYMAYASLSVGCYPLLLAMVYRFKALSITRLDHN